MDNNILKNKWIEVCRNHLVSDDITFTAFNRLENQYAEKGRYYHTFQHIENMWKILHPFLPQIKQPDELFIACMFHDCVYQPLNSDNEEKSAKDALTFLQQTNFSTKQIQFTEELILRTKNHSLSHESDSDDLKWFLDADIAIFMASTEDYFQYSLNIRKEYQMIPEIVYVSKRIELLQRFILQSTIYKTNEFISAGEKIARKNIELEIIRLKSGL